MAGPGPLSKWMHLNLNLGLQTLKPVLFPSLKTALEELIFQKTPMSLFVLCVNLDVNLLRGGDHQLSLKEHAFQDFLIKEQRMKKQALWCAGAEETGSHQISKLAQLTCCGIPETRTYLKNVLEMFYQRTPCEVGQDAPRGGGWPEDRSCYEGQAAREPWTFQLSLSKAGPEGSGRIEDPV